MSPSPTEVERNQRRKLAFIPAWPVVGAVLLAAGCVAYFVYFTG